MYDGDVVVGSGGTRKPLAVHRCVCGSANALLPALDGLRTHWKALLLLLLLVTHSQDPYRGRQKWLECGPSTAGYKLREDTPTSYSKSATALPSSFCSCWLHGWLQAAGGHAYQLLQIGDSPALLLLLLLVTHTAGYKLREDTPTIYSKSATAPPTVETFRI